MCSVFMFIFARDIDWGLGRPVLTLAEHVSKAVAIKGAFVSISHDGDYAFAQVLFETTSTISEAIPGFRPSV
jgi:phosphopantetheinyl transferase (holo-ACP synthase)